MKYIKWCNSARPYLLAVNVFESVKIRYLKVGFGWPPRILKSTTDFRNAAFHDRLAPEYEYEARLSQNANNALNRIAFLELVRHHVPPGATILDFGCGTGQDAQEYVRLGYRVVAYDNSPGMVAQMRVRCAAEIAAGTISPRFARIWRRGRASRSAY